MPGGRIQLIGKPGTAKHINDLRPKTKKAVRAIVRKEVRKLAERKNAGYIAENLQLYHNKPFYIQNLLACTQGVTDPNNLATNDARIGDEVYLRNLRVKFWLSNKLDRPNCMYRIILFWYPSDQTLTDQDVFFTQTNKMLDRPNNENISVLEDRYVFSREMYLNGTEKFEHSYLCTINKNWKNKKITYQEAPNQVKPKNKTLGIAVAVYDAYGTLQTDNIASMAFNAQIQFQDP